MIDLKQRLEIERPKNVIATMTENPERFEAREIRIGPALFRKLRKLHTREFKVLTEESFLLKVLQKGVESFEADT